ncbi:carboxypeptidase-like regulatory domain-containing protein [bacterium]
MINKSWKILISAITLIVLLLIGCQSTTESNRSMGSVSGMVQYLLQSDSTPIYPAYIFSEDNLLATTDENGVYSINSLEEGTYYLTCSALNFADTMMQVQVMGDETTTHDFILFPDNSIGRIYGEFQDLVLYNPIIESDPAINEWNDKEKFEGVTGATLQTKWLQYQVPDRMVFLEDSLLAYSDEFGQFWCKIQCGTYPILGTCEGYESATQVVKVLPDERTYTNFFLDRIQ